MLALNERTFKNMRVQPSHNVHREANEAPTGTWARKKRSGAIRFPLGDGAVTRPHSRPPIQPQQDEGIQEPEDARGQGARAKPHWASHKVRRDAPHRRTKQAEGWAEAAPNGPRTEQRVPSSRSGRTSQVVPHSQQTRSSSSEYSRADSRFSTSYWRCVTKRRKRCDSSRRRVT